MWGWGGDKTETIEDHEGKMYDATGIDVVTRIRFEHLTDEDKECEKAKGLLRLYFKYTNYLIPPLLRRVIPPRKLCIFFDNFCGLLSPFSTWGFFSREQAKSECDWQVMSSMFVASQSSCFFLCSREQVRLVENRL